MPDDAFSRKQACIKCGNIFYVNYPGTPKYDSNYDGGGWNKNVQYCPHCGLKIVAIRNADGSTQMREAYI